MTQEKKAKKYDEALEWMKKVYPTLTGADKEDAEHYFPELKESEDEKIRKELIFFLKEEIPQCSIKEHADKLKEFVSYLEKQKEQKPADSVEEEYIENCNDGTYTCATTKDGFDAFMDGFNKGYDLGLKAEKGK